MQQRAKWRWSNRFFLATLIVFATELAIAQFADGFVRNFMGDVLVVILLFCAIQSVLAYSKWRTAIAVLIFAIGVELAQYAQIPAKLGIDRHSSLGIAAGATFDWLDVAAYALGTLFILSLLLITHINRIKMRRNGATRIKYHPL